MSVLSNQVRGGAVSRHVAGRYGRGRDFPGTGARRPRRARRSRTLLRGPWSTHDRGLGFGRLGRAPRRARSRRGVHRWRGAVLRPPLPVGNSFTHRRTPPDRMQAATEPTLPDVTTRLERLHTGSSLRRGVFVHGRRFVKSPAAGSPSASCRHSSAPVAHEGDLVTGQPHASDQQPTKGCHRGGLARDPCVQARDSRGASARLTRG